MKRVLLTGMSGTGKSTLIGRLAALGYAAVDLDDPGWSEYRLVARQPGEDRDRREWVWRDDAVDELLARDDGDLLFVSGCASNQVRFYHRFDHIVLLTAPVAVMLDRLARRTTNTYGKSDADIAEVAHNQRTVEPLLRRAATEVVDATRPIDIIVSDLLAIAESDVRTAGR